MAGVKYWTATGPLSTTHETQSNKNIIYGEGDTPWENSRPANQNSNLASQVVSGAKGQLGQFYFEQPSFGVD